MARLRFWSVALLALALTGNASQTGRTDDRPDYSMASKPSGLSAFATHEYSCTIYALSERGFDAEMGKWIADTVREVIEPESWKNAASLRYYAPKNILVINHTTDVHGKIERFLKEMKTTLAKAPKTTAAAYRKAPSEGVVPAAYRQIAAPSEPSGYPVPAPVKTPKHLFHFLIRYEGEGIIDDNVVKFMKDYIQQPKQAEKAELVPDPTVLRPKLEKELESKNQDKKQETPEPDPF